MLTWKEVIKFTVKGNPTPNKRVEKTEEEWKNLLTPEQFRVTRQKGTERPNSGALCSIYDEGKYNCICCNAQLFESDTKFDAGCGWPSFFIPMEESSIQEVDDSSHGMSRTEVKCKNL